jgi:8-oxo-dGTP pyrophosphatase MutT (NUDIX family)
MSRALSADVHHLVVAYSAVTSKDQDSHADFLGYFSDREGPVRREDGPSHATASAFIFDQSLTRTLLVFHGKGRFWVQPGGHLEPQDASIADAALRELSEETGVVANATAPLVYDLDHHALSGAFGRCASHLDIGIAVVASDEASLTVSDESEDVRWWPLDALPVDAPTGFQERVRGILARLVG